MATKAAPRPKRRTTKAPTKRTVAQRRAAQPKRSTPRKIARDIDLVYIECRTLSHVWYRYEPQGDGLVNIVHLRCDRGCGTLRFDEINVNTGRLVRRRYKYEDGYKGAPKQKKSDWRLAYLEKIGLH